MPRYGTPSVKTFGSVFKLSRPDIPGGFFSNARRIFIFFHVCLLLIDQLALGGGLAIDIRDIGGDADSVGVHEGSLCFVGFYFRHAKLKSQHYLLYQIR